VGTGFRKKIMLVAPAYRLAVVVAKSPCPELTTQRLRLRPFEPRDVDGLHACFGDSEAMRYWNFPACQNKAETARWVRILARATSPHSYQAWAVAEKRGDRCIGMVNYHHREPHNRRLELGYILAPSQHRQGLMTEALQTLVAYCFGELRTHRIEAMISPDNRASIKLVERLGFQREGGPLRDYWRVGEQYRSVLVYGLIDSDRKSEATHAPPVRHKNRA
jgi:[ribosomal protein S5]-alanine N-acetyltransferase